MVAPLYSAGESPLEGVNAEWLCRGIKDHGHKDVVLCDCHGQILETLQEMVKPGDVVLTLGAGDIYHAGEELLRRLSE